MPKLLDRYIFTELLPPFLISLAVLCFVMLTNRLLFLVELLVSKGLGIAAVAKVVLHMLPSFLVLTLPIAGIIASVSAFSRLSFDKELVVMRAMGLSLYRLTRPVLFFAAMVFGLTLVLAQWGQPWTSVNLKTLALTLLRDQLTVALEPGVFNEPVPQMVIYVDDANGPDEARGIFISDDRNPADPKVIVASRYMMLSETGSSQVGLRLIHGTIHSRPHEPAQYRQIGFETYDLRLALDQRLAPPTPERLPRPALIERLDQVGWNDPMLLRQLLESYKDLAFPTAALVLGMLGAPLGIVSRRSGRTGGFTIGVVVVVAYYVLNVICESMVTTRVIHPFLGAWLPNLIFAGGALWLYVRMNAR